MSNSKRLQETAYDYLKEMILSNELVDNEIYSETKLAQQIGISRTPVRDALQRLSQDGFIDILPSRGFRIHQITPQDVIEIFQIRSSIEGFCTFLLASQYDCEKAINTINQLEGFLKKQEKIILEGGDLSLFSHYDSLFHTTIVDYAQNTEFNKLFNNYMYRINKLTMDSLSHEGRLDTTLKEHYDIYNCIKNGDLENIYKVTLKHMDTPKDINLKHLEDNYNL